MKYILVVPLYESKLRLCGRSPCVRKHIVSSAVLSAHWGGLQCEVWTEETLTGPVVHKRLTPVLIPCLQGPEDRLEYSRSVSGMELVIEELVEVMVLREGLMP